jgi:N-acetylglucosaminyltransferase
VDVLVSCYNEEPALLAACLRSLARQDYKGETQVCVVDDGSDDRDALVPILLARTGLRQNVVPLDGNRGRREAQTAALREGRGEVVVTVDTDTTIAPDGIRHIVAWLRDPSVGAVAGNLRASDADATWLTRLIDTRYRLLFERERAAQGFFGAVLCGAGPFSAYRRTAVLVALEDYLGQQFWGGQRVFGDDLKLTNLVLAAGYESVFEPAARATTDVPTTVRGFVRQQLRWNRELLSRAPADAAAGGRPQPLPGPRPRAVAGRGGGAPVRHRLRPGARRRAAAGALVGGLHLVPQQLGHPRPRGSPANAGE